MPVQTLTAIPCEIVAGDTVIVLLGNATYPATLWTLDLVLSRNGSSLKNVRAAAVDTKHLLTLGADVTSGLAPGAAQTFLAFTEIATGQRVTVQGTSVSIRPNPTGALTKSPKRLALEAAEAHLLFITTHPSMTGIMQTQSVLRSVKDQRMEVDRLRVEVAAEDRSMGIRAPGGARTIVSIFR